ncbi:Asparagine synthetase domain-containing protein [Mycena venus]|uniref:Asparagine synthetase domain-containing protein n=1 Tax=Mycena venus TaxID=2733690 RepID=A0A8H6X5L1_9AGAR|nr:Asparagine synthetase domain-containing protein [Mycena venus]
MCGLISAFYSDSVDPPSAHHLRNKLNASLELVKHRGPDSYGIYVSPDARVGLGHARLSIIDVLTGKQPLSDEDELVHCVVTGEIYDNDRLRAELHSQGYSFKTHSDSELVVQLYKRDRFNLLLNLRGEFAFVLYDLKRRFLFAARDRFGIKPLYYTTFKGCIMFASEMKAFMGLGWQAEWDIDSIVHSGDFGGERTVFKGVQKLPPGYLAICRATGQIETRSYWDISFPAPTVVPGATMDDMISTVRDLLVESVRLRLRSDVPLAVYLSGGIDSSAVAGIATQLLREQDPAAKLTTFTLAYVDDPTTDESPLAARAAAHIGADIHMVSATEAALVDVLEQSIWHSEQPNVTFHAAGKMLLSKAVHEAGYKVVLSGEGSDEIFGGYPFFALDYLRDADPAGEALGILLPSEAERLAISAKYGVGAGPLFASVGEKAAPKFNAPRPLLRTTSHVAIMSLLAKNTDTFLSEVLEHTGGSDVVRCAEEGIEPIVRHNSVMGKWHSLNVSLYVITKTLLGRMILSTAGDRADMANSLESRPPFLDHHLVEYVQNLPPSLKIMPVRENESSEWTLVEKWILREAAKPFITEEVYHRKKVHFNPPPSGSPAVPNTLLPLQKHLKARITQEKVEHLGFIGWSGIKDQLEEYLESPTFPPHGGLDPRARILMIVLSYIVLQERFHVPPLRF